MVSKRPNGYHDLEMLVCPVSLYDRLLIELRAEGFTMTCTQPDIPADESNLVMKASKLFMERLRQPGGVHVCLEKKIPAGAGLGGGSSNAATVLKSLNTFFNEPFSMDDLATMGMLLGADVPFFILARPSWVSGLGEKIEYVEKIKSYKVVVLSPGVSLSTAEVYKKLNFGLTNKEKKIKSPLLNKGLVDPVKHLHNDLESPAISLCPEIELCKDALTIHGAEGVLMSGSGSSVFGLYSDKKSAVEACNHLKTYLNNRYEYSKWQVFLADMIV